MAIDRARLEAAVAELIAAIGEDPAKPEYSTTPERFAQAYEEFFSGLNEDPLDHLRETVPVGDVSDAVGVEVGVVLLVPEASLQPPDALFDPVAVSHGYRPIFRSMRVSMARTSSLRTELASSDFSRSRTESW